MNVMNNKNTLMHFQGNVWLTKPAAAAGPKASKGIHVCVLSDDEVFAAVEYLTLDEQGIYHKGTSKLGTIDSPELKQYIEKLVGLPDDNSQFDEVCAAYERNKSMKKTSKELRISESRIKRILITRGLYTCETHQKVMECLRAGKGLQETAQHVGLTVDGIRDYLPYGYEKEMK